MSFASPPSSAAASVSAPPARLDLSRFAAWRALENAADRYASYGALTLGVAGAALLVLL